MSTEQDILSHAQRKARIHILTLDNILAIDLYERIHYDARMKFYELIVPQKTHIGQTIVEIDNSARDTVTSRLLIMDVRKATLPKLRRAYNKIIGYNRRDLNKLCYTILIGDGPANLFQDGRPLDVFVPYLSAHRVDYQFALFFFDPFIHYEPDEIRPPGIEDTFMFPDRLPERLVPYFTMGEDVIVDEVRRFFRATGKAEQVKQERLKILIDLYEKRIAEQFPQHKDELKAWLSREGIVLANERLNLYPLYFEDWVYDLMKIAAEQQT